MLAQPIFMQILKLFILLKFFLLQLRLQGKHFTLNFIVFFLFVMNLLLKLGYFLFKLFYLFQCFSVFSLSYAKTVGSALIFILFVEDSFLIDTEFFFKFLKLGFHLFILAFQRNDHFIAFFLFVQQFDIGFIKFSFNIFDIFGCFFLLPL